MKRVIMIVLLLAGLGLGALGAYEFFLSGDQARCEQYRARTIDLLQKAQAAQGTPEAAALVNEARSETAVADVACENARQTRRRARLMWLGAVGVFILLGGFLWLTRKRKKVD